MSKLGIFSGEEVCKILAKYGFVEVRRRGSHFIMQRKTETSTITVPVPTHKEIRKGTLRSIIRQSEVPKNEFEV